MNIHASARALAGVMQTIPKKLLKLQTECAAVQTLITKTNQLEYENLAAIYLWWRAASSVQRYLEDAYKPTLVRRVFRESSDELSFRRLLYLIYGIYSLDKDNLDRKNSALLRLHAAHEKIIPSTPKTELPSSLATSSLKEE